jgi:hypothetical protein
MPNNDSVKDFLKQIQEVIIAEGSKSEEKISRLPDGPFKKIALKQLKQLRKLGRIPCAAFHEPVFVDPDDDYDKDKCRTCAWPRDAHKELWGNKFSIATTDYGEKYYRR